MTADAATVAAGISRLQSLPDAYQRVRQVVSDQNASAVDIGDAIAKDQGMTARVLKLANSAMYAFPSRVDHITQAVTIIGTRQILDLALATSVVSMFEGLDPKWVTMRSFWQHAFASACTARELALRCREPNPEQHFVAGLLSSVGRLALYAEMPEKASAALERHHQKGVLLHQAERASFSFHQAELGAELLSRWKLPKSLVQAVRYQYGKIDRAMQPLEPAMVHTALFLVQSLHIGSNGDQMVIPLDEQGWRLVGPPLEALDEMTSQIEDQAEDLVGLLCEDAA